MANLYRNSNDKWRAYGYQKAITTLKKCPKPVNTYEVSLFIPSFLLDKIEFLLGTSYVTRYWFTFS